MLLNFRKEMDIPPYIRVVDHIGPMTKGTTFLLTTVALLGVAALVAGILAKLDYIKLPQAAMNETAFRAMIGGGGAAALLTGIPLVVLIAKEQKARKNLQWYSDLNSDSNVKTLKFWVQQDLVSIPNPVWTNLTQAHSGEPQSRLDKKRPVSNSSGNRSLECCGFIFQRAPSKSQPQEKVPKVHFVALMRFKNKSDIAFIKRERCAGDRGAEQNAKVQAKLETIIKRTVREIHIFSSKVESEAFQESQTNYWNDKLGAASKEN